MNSQNGLALFAKFWQPGQVKTRLAVGIGEAAACAVYFHMLSLLVTELSETGDRRTLVFSPPDRMTEFFELGQGRWETMPQAEGDLGTRMSQFVLDWFGNEMGSEPKSANDEPAKRKLLLIGADCPSLNAAAIVTAFAALDRQPVVLGPTVDGGYYLIGMTEPLIEVFENIAWSTSVVFDHTVAILQAKQIGFELLPTRRDVDDLDDWKAEMSADGH